MTKPSPGLSRRRFLQGTAAVAAGLPAFASSFALGDEKKVGANDRLGLGFIGVGKQNRGHLDHFLGQKEVQVLAVCDVDTTRRENAKKTVESRYAEQVKSGAYKGCSEYNDFRELLRLFNHGCRCRRLCRRRGLRWGDDGRIRRPRRSASDRENTMGRQ